MFKSVFWASLWQRRRSMMIWGVSMLAFGIFMATLYPQIAANDTYAQLGENFEDSTLAALFGEFEDLSTATGYVGAEVYSFMMPLVVLVIGVGYGARTIAKEEDDGTLELLLASPISRSKILFQKAMSLEVQVISVCAATYLGLAIGTLFVQDFDLSLVNLAWVNLAVALVGITMGYFALMLTALGFSRGIALGASIGGFIVMYFANTLPNLVEALEPYRNISIMKYYDYQAVLNDGPNWAHMGLLIAVSIILYLVADWRFKRRDTGV